MRTKHAFTLIEMLLVVMLSGMILTALSFHIFGLSQAYLKDEQSSGIEAHIRGTTELLKSIISTTEDLHKDNLASGTETLESTMDAHLSNFVFSEVPDSSTKSDFCLSFRLNNCPQFLKAEDALPDTINYLYTIQDKGLIITYTSALIPQKDDGPNYNTVTISPFVTKLDYGYYDREYKNWTFSKEPFAYLGKAITPCVIRLTFTYNDLIEQRVVSLERSFSNAPLH